MSPDPRGRGQTGARPVEPRFSRLCFCSARYHGSNATINPDHLAYNVGLKNGDTFAGVLQSDSSNAIVVGVASGESMRIAKNQIASIVPPPSR